MKDQNTSLKLFFLRHAKKNKDGSLSKNGIENATKFFKINKSKLPSQGIEIYHSPIGRSSETARILSKTSPVPVNILKMLPELSEEPYSDETIIRLGIGGGLWLEKKKPSKDLPSTSIITSRIDKIIKHFISETFSAPQENDRVIFCISHAPPIMLYLKSIFEKELTFSRSSGSILDKLGGFIEPLTGLEVIVKEKDRNILEVICKFKSFKKRLDLKI